MQEGRVKASEVGKLLAGLGPAGLDAEQATCRVRRWRRTGVLPPWGQNRDGRTSFFFFTFAQAAITAVLFSLHDRAGITDVERLRAAYDHLASDPDGKGQILIDRLLADVEAGGAPEVWLFIWVSPAGREHTTFHPRFTHELTTVGVHPPGLGWEPVLEGRLPLAPILARFCDADVEAERALH